jgi:hypothetical protein
MDADKLAAEYAQWCSTANRRLDQCVRLIEGGADQQCLQLAETPPVLLDLCAALSCAESGQWRKMCVANKWPVAEALNDKAISRLNDLYAKGGTPNNDLYRDFRRAMIDRDWERAWNISRTINRLSPHDAAGKEEYQRLEGKVRDKYLGELAQVLQKGTTEDVLEALAQMESVPWASPLTGPVVSQAMSVRQTWERERAAEQCHGLLVRLASCRDKSAWKEALPILDEVNRICIAHGITLKPEAASKLGAIHEWAGSQKRAHDLDMEFQTKLTGIVALIENGEAAMMTEGGRHLKALQDALHTLVGAWRDIEHYSRPVDDDLQTRVNRRISTLKAEIGRVVRQRRIIAGIAALAVIVAIVITSVLVYRDNWTKAQVAKLQEIVVKKQVTVAERFIADLKSAQPKAVKRKSLALAIEETNHWIQGERTKLAKSRELIATWQQHASQAFKGLPIESLANDWERTRSIVQDVVPEYQSEQRSNVLEVENALEQYFHDHRRDIEAAFMGKLKDMETASGALDNENASLSDVRTAVSQLDAAVFAAEVAAKPVTERVRLPDGLTGRINPFKERVAIFKSELSDIEKVEVQMKSAVALDEYLQALQKYHGDHLGHLTEMRAARSALNRKRSFGEIDGWLFGALESDWRNTLASRLSATDYPAEVMPAELTKYLLLRDDEFVSSIHKLIVSEVFGNKSACPSFQSDVIILKKAVEPSVYKSGGSATIQILAHVYDPSPHDRDVKFVLKDYFCQMNTDKNKATPNIIGKLTPECMVLQKLKYDGLINKAGDQFQRSLLPLLDDLRGENGVNPLFKAYLHWQLLEIVNIRPDDWGCGLVPAMVEHRDELKKIGVDKLRSQDWLLPKKMDLYGEAIEMFYKKHSDQSYVQQAKYFFQLHKELQKAGMRYGGYVAANGSLQLTQEGGQAGALWGWTEGQDFPVLIRRSQNADEQVAKPLPFTPLFFSNLDIGNVIKSLSSNATLDFDTPTVRKRLPRIFLER